MEQNQISDYEAALLQQQLSQPQGNPYATTMFSAQPKQNLIEWELDFKPELDAIERLLRCDVLMKDKDGQEYWTPNPDKERVFMNELGVNDVIRNIIIIVNKNKALANYDLEEINDRVKQMKHELRVLIYNNYELYGVDNDYKMNNYSMMVLAVGSVVEDVYRRAMNGETHRGLNEQRIVSQTDPLGQAQNPMNYINVNPSQSSKKSHWFAPWTWGKK